MRGNKPLPTAVKKARGNPGRRPLNKSEPSAGRTPEKPNYIKGVSSKTWDRLCEMLGAMGVLDRADGLALELLCEAYAEWRRNVEVIRKSGGVYATKSVTGEKIFRQLPHVAHASDAWKRIRSMLSEFGLTPSARTRLGSPEEGEDELARLMREHGIN